MKKSKKIKYMLHNWYKLNPEKMSVGLNLGFSEVTYFGKGGVPFFEIKETVGADLDQNITLTIDEAKKLAKFINHMLGIK